MSCVKIYTNNYVDQDILANSDVSSEQTSFPVENAYNFQRRSKVWRSNSYWNIDSTNNEIIFRETTMVDLTATIAVAEYTTKANFIAAIKTALDAAGASTYTVSEDTNTLKIKIVSNGLGGGGIFEIDWTTSSAAGILGFDSLSEDTGSLTYIADVLRINTSEWILWDMGVSTNPEAFFMIGPRNSPLKLSPGGTFKLQGNETNVWSSPSFQQTLTYDDEVIAALSETGLGEEAYRYWRILFEDQSNPNNYLEIGAFFLGDSFSPVRGVVQFPWQTNLVDRSNVIFSEGGQSYSDLKEKTQEYTISWTGLQFVDKEDIEQFFDDYGTSFPFFVVFDYDGVFSSVVNRSIKYVKFADEPSIALISPNNFTCQMRLREEL